MECLRTQRNKYQKKARELEDRFQMDHSLTSSDNDDYYDAYDECFDLEEGADVNEMSVLSQHSRLISANQSLTALSRPEFVHQMTQKALKNINKV